LKVVNLASLVEVSQYTANRRSMWKICKCWVNIT